jgi:hypothetical protein
MQPTPDALANMTAALTSETLATRLEAIAENPRTWSKQDRDALVREAAQRLRDSSALDALSDARRYVVDYERAHPGSTTALLARIDDLV